jgi:ribosomal protein S2
MATKTISQREARQLKRRVEQLERMIEGERRSYARTYPGGVHIGHVFWNNDEHIASAVYTAQKLGHAVVAVADGNRKFNLYAIPHPEMPV